MLLPAAALAVAMVSIQFGATLAERLFPVVGAQGTTGLRLAFASLMLATVLRPWRARVPRDIWPSLLGYGASLGAMNFCFYMALRTIPLGVAVATEFSGPLLVAVIGSRRRIDFAWIAFAVIGLALLSPPFHSPSALDPVGMGFALGAGACWALYIVFGQRAGGALGSQATALGSIIAAILVLPVGIAHAGGALLRPGILFAALGVGLFSSALPYSLEMVALTRMPARVYGTLTSVEPAIGALMGLMLLGQTLSVTQWAGIGVVVVAAVGAMRGSDVLPE
jgi:inner membrane transporter RhtA